MRVDYRPWTTNHSGQYLWFTESMKPRPTTGAKKMGLAAFKQREKEQQEAKVENFLTRERAVLFDDLSKIDAKAGADIKRLRKSLREPRIKLDAAQRALDAAKRNHDQLTREVTGIDARITEIFERQRHQRGKLHAQILKVSPVAQDFIERCRAEVSEIEETPYQTARIPTGRRNAIGEPEIIEANNAQSVAARRMALIDAGRKAEKLAATVQSESELQRQLDELYTSLPAIERPTFKLKDAS
jgi:chromosome segregation ATPase